MKKIIFSIVSHGQENLVKNLINSIDENLISHQNEILIIIRENKKNCFSLVSQNFKTKVIINKKQIGFAENHNLSFRMTSSDFFFVINPDVIIHEKFDIDIIIEYLVINKISLSSPKILNTRLKEEDFRRSDLTLLNLFKRWVLKRKDNSFDWLPAIFLIIESKLFDRLNGFDKKFFMYVEDCDFCARAKKIGFEVNEVNFISVIHSAQRESRKSIKYFFLHISSLLKYWFKK